LYFTNFAFQGDSFKCILQHTLKELKTSTTNEEGAKRDVLYNDQILPQLKDGHAM
jgi:hypothetical protein